MAGVLSMASNWPRTTGSGGRVARRKTSFGLRYCLPKNPPLTLSASLPLANSAIALATPGASLNARPSAVLPSRFSAGTSRPAFSKAFLPGVFLTTWNSPPTSRRRLRKSSKSGMVKPEYSARNTASDSSSQASYSARMACFFSLDSAKLFTSLKTKAFAPGNEAKTLSHKNELRSDALPRQAIKQPSCARLHLLSPVGTAFGAEQDFTTKSSFCSQVLRPEGIDPYCRAHGGTQGQAADVNAFGARWLSFHNGIHKRGKVLNQLLGFTGNLPA